MIFCISNLVQYYAKLGIYSRNRLETNGHTLATRENLEKFRSSEGVSLVMVHTHPSFVSWVIMWATSSIYSHAAMLLPRGVLSHMTTSGYIEQQLLDFADNSSYLLIREVTLDPMKTAEIINRIEIIRTQKPHYNWSGAAKLGISEFFSMNGTFRPKHLLDLCFTTLLAYYIFK
jgi:hypothetical protein